jgi:hypothetical protein
MSKSAQGLPPRHVGMSKEELRRQLELRMEELRYDILHASDMKQKWQMQGERIGVSWVLKKLPELTAEKYNPVKDLHCIMCRGEVEVVVRDDVELVCKQCGHRRRMS